MCVWIMMTGPRKRPCLTARYSAFTLHNLNIIFI